MRADALAGETVTTDGEGDGATADDLIETSVTTPNAGPITIEESASTSVSSGYSLLGHQVTISAPDATATSPLVLVFRVDASAIPAWYELGWIGIVRNGAWVGDCTGAAGAATPDPCLARRERLADGDVQLTIRTSRASTWQVLAPRRQPVEIDVKPADSANVIKLSSQEFPVAILSTPAFNATTQIKRASIRFGRTGSEDSLRVGKSGPACGNTDVNGDRLPDLVCHVVTSKTGFTTGTTEALLRAEAVDGARVEGRDAVRVSK